MGKTIGKVIKIPNEYVLIIKLTSDDVEVKEGAEIEVYEEISSIIDPDTGESLGTLTISKDRLNVSSVNSKFIIANKSSEETLILSPLLRGMSKFKMAELNVNEEQNEHLALKNQKICLGDLVRLVK